MLWWKQTEICPYNLVLLRTDSDSNLVFSGYLFILFHGTGAMKPQWLLGGEREGRVLYLCPEDWGVGLSGPDSTQTLMLCLEVARVSAGAFCIL